MVGLLGEGSEATELARALTHPIVLWIARAYLEMEAVHYAHPPIINTLKPAVRTRGTFPGGGWHTDYPYHPQHMPPHFPASPPLGLQCNLCLDAFRSDVA